MPRTTGSQALRHSACTEALRAYPDRTRLVLQIMWTVDGTPKLAGRVLRYLDLTRDGAAQELRKRARWRRVAHTPRAYTHDAFLGWHQMTLVHGHRARYIVMTGTCSRLPVADQINESLAVQPPRRRAEELWVSLTARLLCSKKTFLEGAVHQMASGRSMKPRRERADDGMSASCPSAARSQRPSCGADAPLKRRSRAVPTGPIWRRWAEAQPLTESARRGPSDTADARTLIPEG